MQYVCLNKEKQEFEDPCSNGALVGPVVMDVALHATFGVLF